MLILSQRNILGKCREIVGAWTNLNAVTKRIWPQGACLCFFIHKFPTMEPNFIRYLKCRRYIVESQKWNYRREISQTTKINTTLVGLRWLASRAVNCVRCLRRVLGYLSLLTIWPMRLTQGRTMLKNKSNATLKKREIFGPIVVLQSSSSMSWKFCCSIFL